MGKIFFPQWLIQQHKTYPPTQDLGVANIGEAVAEKESVAGEFDPARERDRIQIT
jgi:hypothetical protein